MGATYHITREGRTATTIPSPSQILLIFLSEPPRNPRPFKKKFYVSNSSTWEYFLKSWPSSPHITFSGITKRNVIKPTFLIFFRCIHINEFNCMIIFLSLLWSINHGDFSIFTRINDGKFSIFTMIDKPVWFLYLH